MKKLILINGSSCSGKSTIIKEMMQKIDGLYYLSFDRIKWGFSDYKENREAYIPIIDRLFLEDAHTILSLEYTIVTDALLRKREELVSLAELHEYQIIEINIEADYEVLKGRFLERVEKAKIDPTAKISNTSLERWHELYETFQETKNHEAKTFRSDILSEKELVAEVLAYINISSM